MVKRRGKVLLLLITVGTLAGCLSSEARSFTPTDTEAASYEGRLKQATEDYWKCLVANSVYRIENKIDYKDADIMALCSSSRDDLYKASFYASFGGYQNKGAKPEFRHATARKDVAIVERSAFGSVKDAR